MMFKDITPAELSTVWNWIAENPDLHMADEGPKDIKQFVDYILKDNIKLCGVHKGKKLVGMIGMRELEDCVEIRGIHFIPEVRGQNIAKASLASIIIAAEPKPVRLRFLADNPYMLHFIKKFYGHFLPCKLVAHRGDLEIPFFAVELKMPDKVTLT